MVNDPALPGAPVLLNRDAVAALLGPAVEAGGGSLENATPHHARYQRGRRLAVRYGVGVSWPDGRRTTETYAALIDAEGLPAGIAVLDGGAGTRIGVWAYPYDPFLPGLPAAAAPASVRRLLIELGAQDGPVRISPRVYRPTSRAVLAVTGAGGSCYLKVLHPDRAEALHALHEALSDRLPVPASYGYAGPQGIVVLEALRGEPLSAALTAGAPVPSPHDLLDLLDRVAEAPASVGQPTPPEEALADHVATLARLLPSEASRATAIAEAATGDWVPDRTVHGDFYEAQVLVERGRVTGLLDVDRLRPGDAVDDLATLLAHLEVLAWARPATAARIRAYRDGVAEAAGARVPTDDLGRRVAGALLGLAGWPFRAQRPGWPAQTSGLLDLAERWLPAGAGPRSQVAHESALMSLSSSSQRRRQQWTTSDERTDP